MRKKKSNPESFGSWRNIVEQRQEDDVLLHLMYHVPCVLISHSPIWTLSHTPSLNSFPFRLNSTYEFHNAGFLWMQICFCFLIFMFFCNISSGSPNLGTSIRAPACIFQMLEKEITGIIKKLAKIWKLHHWHIYTWDYWRLSLKRVLIFPDISHPPGWNYAWQKKSYFIPR